MEVKMIRLRDRDFLDYFPYHEEWRGTAGHDFHWEACFIIDNGIVPIQLKPRIRVGSNYAYSKTEEKKGESYLSSLKEHFASDVDAEYKIKNLPVVIVRREFSDWYGQEPIDNLEIIVVER